MELEFFRRCRDDLVQCTLSIFWGLAPPDKLSLLRDLDDQYRRNNSQIPFSYSCVTNVNSCPSYSFSRQNYLSKFHKFNCSFWKGVQKSRSFFSIDRIFKWKFRINIRHHVKFTKNTNMWICIIDNWRQFSITLIKLLIKDCNILVLILTWKGEFLPFLLYGTGSWKTGTRCKETKIISQVVFSSSHVFNNCTINNKTRWVYFQCSIIWTWWPWCLFIKSASGDRYFIGLNERFTFLECFSSAIEIDVLHIN